MEKDTLEVTALLYRTALPSTRKDNLGSALPSSTCLCYLPVPTHILPFVDTHCTYKHYLWWAGPHPSYLPSLALLQFLSPQFPHNPCATTFHATVLGLDLLLGGWEFSDLPSSHACPLLTLKNLGGGAGCYQPFHLSSRATGMNTGKKKRYGQSILCAGLG